MAEQYGRLTLIERTNKRTPDNHVIAKWECLCGNITYKTLSRVKSGATRSCGCLLGRKPSHGMRYTPEYSTWQSMIRRCHVETDKDFCRYGAKGITVFALWRASFSEFFDNVGARPQGMTLDRINPDKGYEPGNVRWATPLQQALNRRDVRYVKTPAGIMPISEYAKLIGISRGAVHLRMKRGKLEGCSYV